MRKCACDIGSAAPAALPIVIESGRMKILLLGKSGQIGRELQRALAPLGEVIAAGRADADLTQFDRLRKLVRATAPDVLVNAAAYTAVDRAEAEPEQAQRVNAGAVQVMAEEMQRCGGWLVHYSTDYVFDGTANAPYRETDVVGPLNVYGSSKLAGEEAIRASGCRHLIFRTSWVYSAHGSNFVKTLLQLTRERTDIKVVSDQTGAPTGADLIADTTAAVIKRLRADENLAARSAGTYHLTAGGATTWHEYACLLVRTAAADGAGMRVSPEQLVPIPAAQYAAAAVRPANSRLDTAKLRAAFDLPLPHWQPGVLRLLAQLRSAQPDPQACR